MSSTGGDLVDQAREWFDRIRERFSGRGTGGQQRQPQRRAVGGRRAGARTQAVPLGAARPVGGARTGRGGRGRNDRAARSAYTWILAGVLVIGVIALFFALRFVFDSSGSPQAAPKPQVTPSLLPSPSPQSSPPPFLTPVPSPSPVPVGTAAVQQRVHVVEGGDTLNRIAQRYGVTIDAIMQANGFTDRNRILRIGERLVIPDAAPGSPVPR
jgi:hypothetical protein